MSKISAANDKLVRDRIASMLGQIETMHRMILSGELLVAIEVLRDVRWSAKRIHTFLMVETKEERRERGTLQNRKKGMPTVGDLVKDLGGTLVDMDETPEKPPCLVVDKENYTAHKPRRGDYIINGKGKRVALVLCVTGKGAIRVEWYDGHFATELMHGMHWDAWFEQGGRMERETT